MDLGLQGRTAAVAGASTGLGFACARELAAEGSNVALCSRTPEKVHAAVRALAGSRGAVSGHALDVRDHAAARRWVDEVAERFGRLDVVIANAGGPPLGGATDFTVDDYREALELNLLSSVNLVQAALPHMQGNRWGRVLFIASAAAKQPMTHLALSNTARAGVLGYAKSLAHAIAREGITVNVLCPGYTRTERLSAGRPGPGALDELGDREVPLGRVGEPEEFAAAAAFLASERASFITGTALQIDGGMVQSLY